MTRWAVSGYFFINGIAFSSWVARIPDIKQGLHLGDGMLGLALLVAATGTVVGLSTVGRFVDRFGGQVISRAAALAVAVGLIGPGLASNVFLLMAALLFFGLAGGAYNVAMNAQALALDRVYGRDIITSFHAAYSVGGLVGSGLGILAVRFHIGPDAAFPVIAGVLAVGSWMCGRCPDVPTDPRSSRPQKDGGAKARVLNPRIALLGACCFVCLLVEGAIADWSSVYLRNDVGVAAAIAPTGFTVFSVAMAVGRILGDRLAAAVGSMRLVAWSAVVSGTGLGVGLLSNQQSGALLGLGVFGAGLSCITPQMYKTVGEQFPASTGSAVASVATLGYAGLLTGPPTIGLIAHAVGLPSALGLLALLMIPVALASRIVARWHGVQHAVSGGTGRFGDVSAPGR
ncbi:MFS transporter [Streptomyces sp. NBC_01233]|uniref:MFS transporter n=1 Tax=Streptomyces sp. NBC_01233 TaxID=2903787 RepID=UPI002E0DDB7E|nr:MFS transporter [Streptomyces sp. NBC_01233]